MKKPKLQIMLDLETLSTEPNAAIVAIGAVEMNFETRQIDNSFYRAIKLDSSIKAGGHVSASTIQWWMQQDKKAQDAWMNDAVDLKEALESFEWWLERPQEDMSRQFGQDIYLSDACEVMIWGHGAGFDNVILEEAYKSVGMSVPWKFNNNRCYRTEKAGSKIKAEKREGTYHNALDDAKHQAKHLMAIMAEKLRVERLCEVLETKCYGLKEEIKVLKGEKGIN